MKKYFQVLPLLVVLIAISGCCTQKVCDSIVCPKIYFAWDTAYAAPDHKIELQLYTRPAAGTLAEWQFEQLIDSDFPLEYDSLYDHRTYFLLSKDSQTEIRQGDTIPARPAFCNYDYRLQDGQGHLLFELTEVRFEWGQRIEWTNCNGSGCPDAEDYAVFPDAVCTFKRNGQPATSKEILKIYFE